LNVFFTELDRAKQISTSQTEIRFVSKTYLPLLNLFAEAKGIPIIKSKWSGVGFDEAFCTREFLSLNDETKKLLNLTVFFKPFKIDYMEDKNYALTDSSDQESTASESF
jgi:hypothetical protein